jgi:hypothetical protein
MLICQFIAIALAAVKRFDTVVLHVWESARETVLSVLSVGADREADCG